MSIFNKIVTAIRGGAREVGESIVDANGVRIFEQEIKDAEESLEKGKRDLADVVAKEMQATRKVQDLTQQITKHEGYAAQALEQNNEGLALEVAEKIGELQSELEIQHKAKESFTQHVKRLKAMIKSASKSLADMNRQLVMVRTTESVQKATQQITTNYTSSGSKLLSAKESLDRIQQRQQDLEDRLKAGEALENEFDGGSLDDKLKEAGITGSNSSAADILAKIKAKKEG